jgi:hypothetical protein
MGLIDTAKHWIGALTELVLMLVALAIACALLVGGANMSFFGPVVNNVIGVVNDLGKSGLAGLIALGLILWLFSHRKLV